MDTKLQTHISCGVGNRQAAQLGPEVEHVAVGGTIGVETLEHVFAQVHRERSVFRVGRFVKRTGSAALRAGAEHGLIKAEASQHPVEADLATQGTEVDERGGW